MVLLPFIAHAGSFEQDAVVDKRGNVAKNTFKNCVLTKWQGGVNGCEGRARTSRSYIVFFDFNSVELTADSEAILKRAYNDARNKNANFDVVGHADRSGSADYNVGLSKRRALTVKSELARLGIKRRNVQTSAKGESAPLVSTADGVKEPQNRRVEVTFTY